MGLKGVVTRDILFLIWSREPVGGASRLGPVTRKEEEEGISFQGYNLWDLPGHRMCDFDISQPWSAKGPSGRAAFCTYRLKSDPFDCIFLQMLISFNIKPQTNPSNLYSIGAK